MLQTRAIPPQLILAHAFDDLVERGDDLRGLPRQPPRVEYALTLRGRAFVPVLEALRT